MVSRTLGRSAIVSTTKCTPDMLNRCTIAARCSLISAVESAAKLFQGKPKHVAGEGKTDSPHAGVQPFFNIRQRVADLDQRRPAENLQLNASS